MEVAAFDIKIREYDNAIDTLKKSACNCGDKRKRSQEEYITPSPNLELITDDEIRDNEETDWNKEDSPTPAPDPSKNREKKRPRIETISKSFFHRKLSKNERSYNCGSTKSWSTIYDFTFPSASTL